MEHNIQMVKKDKSVIVAKIQHYKLNAISFGISRALASIYFGAI
ncbi:MAG: hypothetical protein P1P88_22285 [Bacteroidales bacterium]|nr:hypothetical protein [Bacteroidales bacterium]